MSVTLTCTGTIESATVFVDAPDDAQKDVADTLVGFGFLPDVDDAGNERFIAGGRYAIRFWAEGVWSLPEDWNLLVPEAMQRVVVKDVPSVVRLRSDADGPGPLLRARLVLLRGDKEVAGDDLRLALETKPTLLATGETTAIRVDPEAPANALALEQHRTATFVKHPAVAEAIEKAAGGEAELPLVFAPVFAGAWKGVAAESTVAGAGMGRVVECGKLEAPVVPSGFVGNLYSYQVVGCKWGRWLYSTGIGGILADSCGLGKSAQTIAVLLGVKETNGRIKSIAICPKSVAFNWRNELLKFAPSLSVHVWDGPNRHRDVAKMRAADVVVTSYPLLRLDQDVLCAQEYDIAVADEAQCLSNPASGMSKAACRLRARTRLALTGTPVSNRLGDLHAIMMWANPGMLGSAEHFDRAYAKPIGAGDADTARRLREIVRTVIIRRTKADAQAYLPELTEVHHIIPMEEAQAEIYNGLRDLTRRSFAAAMADKSIKDNRKMTSVLAMIMALRRGCTDLRLLTKVTSNGKPIVPSHLLTEEHSGKAKALRELLTELMVDGAEDENAVILFSNWTTNLDLAQQVVASLGISFTRLDGNTKDREDVVSKFQDRKEADVILVSIGAASVGINLFRANVVIFLDAHFNPAVEYQALSRAHRNGVTRPVTAYRFVAKNSIEERVMDLKKRKMLLADSVLEDGGTMQDNRLTLAQIKSLLEE